MLSNLGGRALDRESVAAYWMDSPEFEDGGTVARVHIDDETGPAELDIHLRPREQSAANC